MALTGANVHDSKVLAELVDSIVPVWGQRGRPRKRPGKLHADKGYDFPRFNFANGVLVGALVRK